MTMCMVIYFCPYTLLRKTLIIQTKNYTCLKLDDDLAIRIYNIERTICDIIRDRNKIDLQIFNTALNEYMKRKDKNLILLSEYATKFKIEKILAQYMEVLG